MAEAVWTLGNFPLDGGFSCWNGLPSKKRHPPKKKADWQRLCDPMQVLAGGVASDVDEGEVDFEGAMWRVLRGNCVMAARRSWRFRRLRWMG